MYFALNFLHGHGADGKCPIFTIIIVEKLLLHFLHRRFSVLQYSITRGYNYYQTKEKRNNEIRNKSHMKRVHDFYCYSYKFRILAISEKLMYKSS